jgi:inosose dehydratase
MKQTRLNFLKTIGLGAIISQANSISAKNISINSSLNLGLASYILRDYSLDDTIMYAKGLNLTHIALKSMHLPLDSKPEYIKEVARKISDAGLKMYGAGVIYMKTEAEVDNAFSYAQNAGIEMIMGVPNHELLPLVEKKVKETGIKLAIHNHGPGDKVYPTPDTVFEHIKNLDNRIGMCIDVGHVVRLGLDPVKNIIKYSNRLFDMHLKDVNKVAEDGSSVEIGRGVIDIPAILKALQKINYKGVMAIEYEKDGKTAILGLSESVGYVRGIKKMV